MSLGANLVLTCVYQPGRESELFPCMGWLELLPRTWADLLNFREVENIINVFNNETC